MVFAVHLAAVVVHHRAQPGHSGAVSGRQRVQCGQERAAACSECIPRFAGAPRVHTDEAQTADAAVVEALAYERIGSLRCGRAGEGPEELRV